MWTPQVHADFPPPFRRAVLTMLMGTRRVESLLYLLDEELIYFIMNKVCHAGLEPQASRDPRQVCYSHV